VSWKHKQQQWKDQESKKKFELMQHEIEKNHIENKRYSERIHSARSTAGNGSCLSYYGVDNHLERQYKAQKEKFIVEKLKAAGAHRNVKRRKRKTRVTIPKSRYIRKHIQESINVIQNQSIPSSITNQKLTTQDLAEKGFSVQDIVKVANDIERDNRELKYQYKQKDNLSFPEDTQYTTAVESLRSYMHSFEL